MKSATSTQKPYIIGIAGPSCSGKSSITRAIAAAHPGVVLPLFLDNYYKNPADFTQFNGMPNWESPENLQFDLLVAGLRAFKNSKPAGILQYDPATKSRIPVVVDAKPILIVEGFLLLYSEEVRELLDFSYYVDISHEQQIERRVERQSRDCEVDIDALRAYVSEVVVGQYQKFGEPTKAFASQIISPSTSLEDATAHILHRVADYLA